MTPSREPSEFAKKLTLTRKMDVLSKLSEDEFRDRIVRPVLERRGLKTIAETCGSDEDGKDCIMLDHSRLGALELWAIQTKRGPLSMGSDVNKNVEVAISQLRTALAAQITIHNPRLQQLPSKVLLIASGKISKGAKEHIHRTLNDGRIQVLGSEDIIPLIDEQYPEFWIGVAASKFPYLQKLSTHLLKISDTLSLCGKGSIGIEYSPIADSAYAQVYVSSYDEKYRRSHGQTIQEHKFTQFPLERIVERREKLILITGDGGSGKTTGLRRLAFKIAQDTLTRETSARIPVIFRAADFSSSSLRLSEYAATVTVGISGTDEAAFTERDLVDGNVFIIVDGLDEVASGERAIIISKILDFHNDFPNCVVLLSSREYRSIVSMPTVRGFRHFRIQPIDMRQAAKIFDTINESGRITPVAAKEALRRLNQVHGFDLNPLLVTIFAASADVERGDIPPNITEVFSKFTEMMLGRWDIERGIKHQYRPVVKDFLLCRLGFEMHKEGVRVWPVSRVRELVSAELEKRGFASDFAVFFDEVLNRCGLLIVDGDNVEFRHHLIQEYFAGRGVVDPKFFGTLLDSEWWRMPLVFCFGSRPQNVELLQEVYRNAVARDQASLFDSAVSVGLAMQACYLSETDRKVDVLRWVVRTLSATVAARVGKERLVGDVEIPLSTFLVGYLIGREAVGCKLISGLSDEFLKTDDLDPAEADYQTFWCIAGLIEDGDLKKVSEVIKNFRPADARLLLAIHLGLVMYSNLRIVSENDRKIAGCIAEEMEDRVAPLRAQVLEEFKSYYLEYRRGNIVAMESDPVIEGSQGAAS